MQNFYGFLHFQLLPIHGILDNVLTITHPECVVNKVGKSNFQRAKFVARWGIFEKGVKNRACACPKSLDKRGNKIYNKMSVFCLPPYGGRKENQ